MKIIVDLGHPAHVHLFKNFMWEMERRGHEILIIARDKEMLLDLLDRYGFAYMNISKQGTSLPSLAWELLKRDYRLFFIARSFRPDLLMGCSEIISHVGKILGKPSVMFTDTEHATLSNWIAFPFASTICVPSCFKNDLGNKEIRYNGYHELAYLHPDRFTPDITVLNTLGLTPGEPYTIVRFVSWGASHDIGHHGIRDKVAFVKALEPYGHILISSEGPLPIELEKYRIRIPREKMHDLLYYATLYIGEGATMASEAALLGTPSLFISSLVGTMGNFVELEQKYELMYSYSDAGMALQKSLDILRDPHGKKIWAQKRERLLKDKIDVTAFMVRFIENYPQSFIEMKHHQKNP